MLHLYVHYMYTYLLCCIYMYIICTYLLCCIYMYIICTYLLCCIYMYICTRTSYLSMHDSIRYKEVCVTGCQGVRMAGNEEMIIN